MGKRHAVPLHEIVVAYCFCAIEPSSLLWSLVPDQATKKNNSSGKYCYSIIQFRMLGLITVLKGMIFFPTELFARLIANACKKKLFLLNLYKTAINCQLVLVYDKYLLFQALEPGNKDTYFQNRKPITSTYLRSIADNILVWPIIQ